MASPIGRSLSRDNDLLAGRDRGCRLVWWEGGFQRFDTCQSVLTCPSRLSNEDLLPGNGEFQGLPGIRFDPRNLPRRFGPGSPQCPGIAARYRGLGLHRRTLNPFPNKRRVAGVLPVAVRPLVVDALGCP